jgi:Sec-independent protein translocase protein TatA
MNAWSKLVQKTYSENKHKAGYKLKNAMKDAKKVYKTFKNQGGAESKGKNAENKNKSKKSRNKSSKKSQNKSSKKITK